MGSVARAPAEEAPAAGKTGDVWAALAGLRFVLAAMVCCHGVDLPARRLVRARLNAQAVTSSGQLD